MKKIKKHIILLIMAMAIGQNLHAQNTSSQKEHHELRAVIETALRTSPFTKKINAQEKRAEAAQEQVDALKYLPELKLTVRSGVVPEAKGDVFYSPNKQDEYKNWGPFVQSDFSFVQPLYSFGRFSSAEELVEEGIKLQDKINLHETDEFKYIVAESYWTLFVLQQGLELANEVEKNFDKLLQEIDKEEKKEDSDIDQTDVLEVKSNAFMIEKIIISSKQNYMTAQNAFKLISSLDSIELKSQKIINIDDINTIAALDYAFSNRKDLQALESGIKAIEKQISIKNKEQLPLLYLAGGVRYSWANNRDDQKNPFVYDNFNYLDAGAFLGLQWKLNFLTNGTLSEKDKYEVLVQRENLNLLKKKIEIEVNKALNDCRENSYLLEKIEESISSAETWLALSLDNWQMGLGDAEQLIKAYKIYYELKGKKLELILNYHKSLADLARKTSSFDKYLEWLDEEKVSF